MKKTSFTWVLVMLVAGTMLFSCQTPAKKVENAEVNLQDAKDNVVDAKQELSAAKKDSISEYQKFKNLANEKIAAQDKSIAEFKARVNTEKRADKASYDRQLDKLEKKNTDMKKKLADYKETSKDNWDKFKLEFNHDMDEFGKAFHNLTVKNVK